MAVEIQEAGSGNTLVVRATGKLAKEDYAHFVPEVERLIKANGKVRILLELHDFHGWEASALWEDMKFDIKHFKDIERLAIVGESAWEKGMATFCKPFTTAKIKYFDRANAAEAKTWIDEA